LTKTKTKRRNKKDPRRRDSRKIGKRKKEEISQNTPERRTPSPKQNPVVLSPAKIQKLP
jgi:hypothetical protein